MTQFSCPICGKNSSYSKYDPTNFDDDIIGIEVRGLGRGRGFEVTERYSLLGDTWLTGLISRRCHKTLRMIEGHEPASNTEVQKLLTINQNWVKWGENTQRKLNDKDVIINNFESQNRKLLKDNNALREQLTRFGPSVFAAETEKLRRTIRDWATWGEQTKKALIEKDAEITSLRTENKRLSKNVSSLREELKDAEEESASSAEAEELLDKINASCNTDYDDLGEAIDFLLE